MSERYGSYPPDEPVIGANYPPLQRPASTEPYIGGAPSRTEPPEWGIGYERPAPATARGGAPAYPEDDYAEEPYDDDEYEAAPAYDDEEDEYAYDEDHDYYGGQPPARQPIFYVFLGLAVLVGAAVIFLVYSLTRDDSNAASPTATADFRVSVDSPTQGQRIETNKDLEVQVQATSNEPIARFELFVGDRSVDTEAAVAPASGSVYHSTLKTRFDRRGDYTLFVRVTSNSGASKDSGKVTVTAFEGVGDAPVSIDGKVLAKVNVRTGPGEQYDISSSLDEGTIVKILGKTRDGEWLYVDVDGGRWVKRTAIQEQDSLALVPIREPTPTPQPTAADTPTPEPTPSTSPTASANAPDFVPVDARFVFSGDGQVTLRLSIRNDAAAYNGPLVVGVTTSPGSLVTSQLVFNADIGTGKTMTADFEVTGQLAGKADVTVKVDPANAIKEASEDNNTTTFKNVAAPVDAPNLVISDSKVLGNNVIVTVLNNGGDLPASDIKVVVALANNAGDASATQPGTALKKGNTVQLSVSKPGTGDATITIMVNGEAVASAPITLP